MLEIIFLAATIANLCWDNPTQNVDGTDLTDLQKVTVYYSGPVSGSFEYPTTEPGINICTDIEVAQAGQYDIYTTSTDELNNESAPSNTVSKAAAVIDPEPLPPIVLTQDETVYTVIKQPNRFILLPIGTVPAGTVCDPNNSVNGYGVVPTEDVVWTSPTSSRPVVVVAQCN